MVKKHTTRKLFLKIEYLSLELEETLDNFQEYREMFNKEFHQELQYLISLQNKQKIIIHPEISIEKSHPRFVQKIYRNIAKKLHPDVSDKTNAEEIFKEVTENYETNNLIGLIMISNHHKIPLPDLTDDNLKEIEENIKKTEERIAEPQKTLAWVWANTEEDKASLKDKVYEMLGVDKNAFEEWKP